MKIFYTTLLFFMGFMQLHSQTVILDFESAATSTTFQYFGSPLDGSLNSVVANPSISGINTSANVSTHIRPGTCETWAGAFSNPKPATPVDLVNGGKVHVKVFMDHIGSVSLKLEVSTDGGDNWILTVPNTKVNEWEELVFDVNLPSIEAPNTVAKGHTYTNVVLFYDFLSPATGTDNTSYFDDIIVESGAEPICNNVLDFETADTKTVFQYFGSTLDATLNRIVQNPITNGINTSDSIAEFIKPAVAETWAGAFSNPNPVTKVDLVQNAKIKVKVLMDHIGSVSLKLEGASDGSGNWLTTVANTKVNEWEELVFDANLPSIEAPFTAAKGHVYDRLVFFFDFGTPGTGVDQVYYVDDVCTQASAGPQLRTLNFVVDMNEYASNFDNVYLSGTFNNWSGDGNPLSDTDGDGIWTGSLELPVGAYEYKVTLDNWNGQEQFNGTEECTVKDPSGQFVNRRLLVTNDATYEFCYNTCYKCGEGVSITFALGMGDVVPSPDGVWLAGGANFDVPGGKYKLNGPDVNNVYTLEVFRKAGFNSFYTFTNGPCADYSCKENLEGLPCGHPENYNDRFLDPVTSDITVATCFGTCYTNTSCTSATIDNSKTNGVTILNNPDAIGNSALLFDQPLATNASIQLANALGQNVQLIKADKGQTQIDLPTNNLKTGIYFVRITMGDTIQVLQLIRL